MSSSTSVGYDNDSGTGSFSLITKATLAAGTYYVGIRENGDNAGGDDGQYFAQGAAAPVSPPSYPNSWFSRGGDQRSRADFGAA